MIDLRYQLPDSIESGGELFKLRTDFRVWIEWLRCFEEDGIASFACFEREIPSGADWVSAAVEFAQSDNATPKKGNDTSERTFDFILDGDYLVGAFWQAYGIDLTEAHLHWHTFLALFRSLPEGTKLYEIMGYRGYKKTDSKKKIEAQYEESKRRWRLPPRQTPQSRVMMEWQKQSFGNITFEE